MRLRLTVKRHELPAVKLLFGVPAGEHSIAQLMELVNDTVPLESDQWAIEDYVVLFEGYECLHYQDARAILEDRDEVEIRPLSTPEKRMRRAAGRLQVSDGGARLVDGVAFGRPFAHHAQRPSVHIPPPNKSHTTAWDAMMEGLPQSRADLPEQNPRTNESQDPALRHNTSFSTTASLSEEVNESTSSESSALSSSLASETSDSTSNNGKGDISDNGKAAEISTRSEAASSPPSSAGSSEDLRIQRAQARDVRRTNAFAAPLNKSEGAVLPAYGKGKRATQSRNRRRRDAKRRRFLEEFHGNRMAEPTPMIDSASSVVSPEVKSRRDRLLNAVSMTQSVQMFEGASSSLAKVDLAEVNMAPRPSSPTVAPDNDYEAAEAIDQLVSTSWRDRITISAVECIDSDIELSAPPFPFRQRWDPQYRYRNRRGKKRKHHEAGLDGEDALQMPTLLPSGADASPGDFRGAGDLEKRQESSGEWLSGDPMHGDDGVVVPHLPGDKSVLPSLERHHLRAGAIILFRQFEVSLSTGWRPDLSKHKVAVIEDYDEATALIKARLIQQDAVARDEQGRRVYYGFEMPVQDEDEDHEDQIEMSLTDCVDAKLLKASTSSDLDADDTFTTDPGPHIVLDSVNTASYPPERNVSSHGAELSLSKIREGPEGSQATSVASTNLITQDQAAQVRGSMLLHRGSNDADRTDGPYTSIETSGG